MLDRGSVLTASCGGAELRASYWKPCTTGAANQLIGRAAFAEAISSAPPEIRPPCAEACVQESRPTGKREQPLSADAARSLFGNRFRRERSSADQMVLSQITFAPIEGRNGGAKVLIGRRIPIACSILDKFFPPIGRRHPSLRRASYRSLAYLAAPTPAIAGAAHATLDTVLQLACR